MGHPGDLGLEMIWRRARAVIAEAEENQRTPLVEVSITLKSWTGIISDGKKKRKKHLKERLETQGESGRVCLPRNS